MSYIFPTKPTNGGDENTWGTELLAWMTDVEDAINALDGAKAATNHTHDYAASNHNHSGVYAPTTHNHATTEAAVATSQNDIITINNTLSVLNPNLASVSINIQTFNVVGGVRIIIQETPSVLLQRWVVTIKKGANVLATIRSSSNDIFVMPGIGFAVGDTLTINCTIYSGSSSKDSDSYSHTYARVNSTVENDVAALQTQLASININALVSAIASSESALQSIANILQHSNTLASKIGALS